MMMKRSLKKIAGLRRGGDYRRISRPFLVFLFAFTLRARCFECLIFLEGPVARKSTRVWAGVFFLPASLDVNFRKHVIYIWCLLLLRDIVVAHLDH